MELNCIIGNEDYMKNNADNWNVKNICSYEKMIAESIINGYKVDKGIFTTYSLDMQVLNKLFVCLDCAQIIKNGIDVFYDVQDLKMDESSYKPVSETHLHGVNLYEEGQKYAFHPKIILLRYVNLEQNQVRYVMVVSSKNITSFNFLDAFCVVYGDVKKFKSGGGENESKNNGKSNNINREKCNGEKVACFIAQLYEKVGSDKPNQICDELEKVNFRCADEAVTSIDFFTEVEMNAQLEKLKDMIVVSPFLSDDFVEKLNIKKIVSTSQSFGSLKDEHINDQYYRLIDAIDIDLHAKIYYGMVEETNEDKRKALCILGSSNATHNGCALGNNKNHVARNVEFNVALEVSEEEYMLFENSLDKLITSNIIVTKERDKSKEGNRHVLGNFLQEMDEIVIQKKDGIWQLIMKYKKKYKSSHMLKMSIDGNGNNIWIDVEGESTIISTKNPIDTFGLQVGNAQDGGKEYRIRIAPYIKNMEGDGKEYLNALEQMHDADFVEVMKKLVDGVFARSQTKYHYSFQKELKERAQQVSRRQEEKQCIFEKLKKLALETWKEVPPKSELEVNEQREYREREYKQKYKEKLQKLREYLNVLQDQDEECKTMLNAIKTIMDK